MIIHLDFETRSAADLRKTGVYRYAADRTTDVICAAWAADNGPVSVWTPTSILDVWDALETDVREADEIWAHNAMFERLIWWHVMAVRYCFPPVHDGRWRCTAAMAAAAGLPRSLDRAAKSLNLPLKKDLEGRRIMLKCSRPAN